MDFLKYFDLFIEGLCKEHKTVFYLTDAELSFLINNHPEFLYGETIYDTTNHKWYKFNGELVEENES